jgi:hypothetical protein
LLIPARRANLDLSLLVQPFSCAARRSHSNSGSRDIHKLCERQQLAFLGWIKSCIANSLPRASLGANRKKLRKCKIHSKDFLKKGSTFVFS